MASHSRSSEFDDRYLPYSDMPVDGLGERKDELNRWHFCRQVGNLLLASGGSDGIVVSIEGEWGSGKSSVLRMIRCCIDAQKQNAQHECPNRTKGVLGLLRRLRGQRLTSSSDSTTSAPILVEFNPWLVGAADHMVQVFMAQIASEIGHVSKSEKATEAAQKLIAYSQLLEPLKWIPGAEPWTSIVKGVIESTGRGVSQVAELHKLNVSQRRDDLKASLRYLARKIIIFIDDIDRLPPAEVFQIVRSIQAVSDLPGCSFVIALDPHYTENALRSAANFDNPGQYLDKLIQLRLALPHLNQADLATYFQDRFFKSLPSSQLNDFQAEQQRLGMILRLGVLPLVQTPRDVIRIINRFLFVLSKCGNEVCWGDLLGLQAIAIILPAVYTHIAKRPGAYTGVHMAEPYQRGSSQENVDQLAGERNETLQSSASLNQAVALRLLEILFPLIRSFPYDKLSQGEFSKSRRIAASDRLKIALSYDLPSDEISLADIKSFCFNPADREDVVRRILSRNLLDHFLESVLNHIDPVAVSDTQDFIFLLGRLVEGQKIHSGLKESRFLIGMTTIDKIVLLSDQLLARSDDDANDLSGLSVYVSNSSILSLATHLLAQRLGRREEGSHQRESRAEVNFISTSDDPVLQQWLETSVSAIRSQDFLEAADKSIVMRVLLSLREGREQLPELLLPYFDSGQRMDAIADLLLSSQGASTEGPTFTCREDYLSLLGDVEGIREKAMIRLRDPSVKSDSRLLAIYMTVLDGRKRFIDESGQVKEWM